MNRRYRLWRWRVGKGTGRSWTGRAWQGTTICRSNGAPIASCAKWWYQNTSGANRWANKIEEIKNPDQLITAFVSVVPKLPEEDDDMKTLLAWANWFPPHINKFIQLIVQIRRLFYDNIIAIEIKNQRITFVLYSWFEVLISANNSNKLLSYTNLFILFKILFANT